MKQIQTLFIAIIFFSFAASMLAQDIEKTNTNGYPKWRIGADAGLNLNMTGMGYQDLSPRGADYYDEVTNDGFGLGPRIGLFGEYLSGDWWGAVLRFSYDSRNVISQDESYDPISEFDITASYITIEPMLRIDQPWVPYLNARIGPAIGLNLDATYDYKEDKDGDAVLTDADMPNARGLTMGATAGFSYDILLNDMINEQRWFLSPYVDINWLMSQKDPTAFFEDIHDNIDDTWSTVTLTVGLKASLEFVSQEELAAFTRFDNLSLTRPIDDIVRVREVEDFFPLVQHVFFDQGSQDIPARYVTLPESAAKDFGEEDLQDLTQMAELADMSKTEKQLFVYYNIMNIFAHRMRENEDEDLLLIGSAPKADDGDVIAQKVKDYLVNNFGIDPGRINTEGRDKPRVPSGTSSTPMDDRPLTEIENRRVEFVFNNQKMYDPIKIKLLDEASLENDLVFAINPDVEYDNWNVIITGEGKNLSYGPFYSSIERINPVELVSEVDRGTFTAKVLINNTDGTQLEEESKFLLIKETEESKLGARYTVLFEYAQSDPITANETLLRQDIAPEIEEGNRLIIHGHTDQIGKQNVNRELSFNRATQAKEVLDDEFNNLNRNIDIEAFGFGEQNMPSTFTNDLPEGRFYNRNVTIEVIPLSD